MNRAFFIGLLVVILAATGAGWYAWHTGAIGFNLQRTPEGSSQSAVAESVEAVVATLPRPSNSQFDAWKDEMGAQCAKADNRLHVERFDVDGDGKKDLVCWRVIKTQPYGDFVDLQARVQHGGKVQYTYDIFSLDGAADQGGVCGPADSVTVEQTTWTRQQFKDLEWDHPGLNSLSVGGGDCDPMWLFWPKEAKGDEVEFDYERM